MQKMLVKNFGPIREAELEIGAPASLTVLIGAQASGKSTLAKCAYFCKKIRDMLIEQAIRSAVKTGSSSCGLQDLMKLARERYQGYFGTSAAHCGADSILRYRYDAERDDSGSLDLTFTPRGNVCVDLFGETLTGVEKFFDEISGAGSAPRYPGVPVDVSDIARDALIFEGAYDIFKDSSRLIYIPAGRHAAMRPQGAYYDEGQLSGTIMRDFRSEVQRASEELAGGLDKIAERAMLDRGDEARPVIDRAREIISGVLRAEYTRDDDGERLTFRDGGWVELDHASSGQQEVVRILLLLFMAIARDEKCFFFIEEPEAHIFPDAQLEVMKLIALTMNATGSEMFITTHSPYILTSLNMLMLSERYESGRSRGGADIVPPAMRLAGEHARAYMICDGRLEPLMDSDAGMIDASRIDAVSDEINDNLDAMLGSERAG